MCLPMLCKLQLASGINIKPLKVYITEQHHFSLFPECFVANCRAAWEMGIVRPDESRRMEIEELRRMLLSCAGVYRRKEEEALRLSGPAMPLEQDDKLVCVIGGVSYLGIAIVNQLLLRGYSVRILVDNEGAVLQFLLFSYILFFDCERTRCFWGKMMTSSRRRSD